jgi:hypothetical protein
MIIQYLEYLKEMSRKIIQSSGFENVLARRAGGNYFSGSISAAEGQRYLSGVFDRLSKEQNQKLFCGTGLIIGCVKRRGDTRRVAAPLVYCLAETYKDEQNYKVELDEFSISLNYDLVTAILDIDDIGDEELDDARELSKISPVFVRVSDGFAKGMKKGKGTEIFSSSDGIIKVFDKIQSEASEFRSINVDRDLLGAKSFGFKKLSSYFEDPPTLRFFPETFFYVAPFPNQLSTYVALEKLIEQVS